MSKTELSGSARHGDRETKLMVELGVGWVHRWVGIQCVRATSSWSACWVGGGCTTRPKIGAPTLAGGAGARKLRQPPPGGASLEQRVLLVKRRQVLEAQRGLRGGRRRALRRRPLRRLLQLLCVVGQQVRAVAAVAALLRRVGHQEGDLPGGGRIGQGRSIVSMRRGQEGRTTRPENGSATLGRCGKQLACWGSLSRQAARLAVRSTAPRACAEQGGRASGVNPAVHDCQKQPACCGP